MYFFRSIVLILLIIISCFMIYLSLINNKIDISKRKIIFTCLTLIQGLFILFGDNLIYFIFLDFSCILGYKLKMNREALTLSLINILYCLISFEIPLYFYLLYLIYYVVNITCIKNKKDPINYLLFFKSFFTSLICFLYLDYSSLDILILVFSLIYFSVLLKYNYYFLKKYEERSNDDNMIFQIAHEVKNPISVCKGYLDMLDVKDKNKVNKYIPIVKSEMNRALTIMDDFLSLKRLTINKDIMDLSLLLEDISATMDSILGNNDTVLDIDISDEEIIMEADYDRLKQVLINLIKNSYEANSKNIEITTRIKKDKVEIVVIDDGDGISNKDIKKIGTVFYTTKVKGTGIGVSMSKEIVKLHNGTIKYDSKVGEGTKVVLTLPYKFTF